MTRALRQWKPAPRPPKKPELPELPPADARYWELETMKAYGQDADAWELLSARARGEMMAHEFEKSMREAYTHERMYGDGDDRPKKPNSWRAMHQHMTGD